MTRSLWCAAVLCLAGCELFSEAKRAAASGDGVSASPAAVVQTPTARTSAPAGPTERGTGAAAAEDRDPGAAARAPTPSRSAPSTPEKGSPERAAILDAIRPWTETQVGQPVIFSVDHLAVKDGYAFVSGRPLQPDGQRIDYRKTKFRKDLEEGVFNDHLSALVRQTDGEWKLLASSLGATDVPWVSWPADHGAPKEIFPGPID